jgi:ankyrin repeat protein
LVHGASTKIGGGTFGSCLHLATTKFQVSLLKELLKHGADPNSADLELNTPLHLLFSIFGKDSVTAAEIAFMMIEFGADPNHLNVDGWAPIHLAIRRGQIDCIRWIIKHNLMMNHLGKTDKVFNLNL